jgi:hypothetical protein
LKWIGELLVLVFTLWPVWVGLVIAWWGFRKWRTKKVARS